MGAFALLMADFAALLLYPEPLTVAVVMTASAAYVLTAQVVHGLKSA